MKNLTPTKAIRLYCLQCSGGAYSEVRDCIIKDCTLYPFRLGKNPNYKQVIDIIALEENPSKTQENSKEF